MESAIRNVAMDAAVDLGRPGEDGFAARERGFDIVRLEHYRGTIEGVDPADKASWRHIITALLSAGFQTAELETELAASQNTLYKWREGLAAPREMTRRLLKRAILEMLDERLAALRD